MDNDFLELTRIQNNPSYTKPLSESTEKNTLAKKALDKRARDKSVCTTCGKKLLR